MTKWRLDPGQIEVLDDAVAAVFRRKTVAQRIAMVLDCNRTARLLLQAATKRRHPDWTDAQVLAEVARSMLSEPGRTTGDGPADAQ